MALNLIIRLNPITNTPVLFDAMSKTEDGHITAYVGNEKKVVEESYYQNSMHLTKEDAHKVAVKFAEHEGIPLESIFIRERLPKQQKEAGKNRRLNDANLVLVQKGDKQADEMAIAAQALHDSETKPAQAPEKKAEDAQPRQKRAYNKKSSKEVSARSKAAMARYLKEVQQISEDTPASPEVQASPTMSEESLKEQKMLTALRLAKEITGDVKPSLIKAIMELL